MFEVASMAECHEAEKAEDGRPPSKARRTRAKTHTFANLTSVLSSWHPEDPLASRRLLASEIQTILESKKYSCVKACIPAIVVDKQHPIDLMHYRTDGDIDEFMARMLWMRQEYDSAIGILLGIPDEESAAKVEEAYESLLRNDADCVIILT
jgi:hypothetical protein